MGSSCWQISCTAFTSNHSCNRYFLKTLMMPSAENDWGRYRVKLKNHNLAMSLYRYRVTQSVLCFLPFVCYFLLVHPTWWELGITAITVYMNMDFLSFCMLSWQGRSYVANEYSLRILRQIIMNGTQICLFLRKSSKFKGIIFKFFNCSAPYCRESSF